MPSVATRILSVPASSTVGIADEVTRLRKEGSLVLDFSAGRAMEDTPAYICNAAVSAVREGDTHQTPAQGKLSYLEACAEKLARENNLEVNARKNVIATLGCKQGLVLTLLSILDEGDEIIVEDPGFVSYQPAIQFCGATPVPIPLTAETDFRWTREALLSKITPRTRAILFCSPHNPTGVVHSEEDLRLIARVAEEHDLYVIADEIYERVTWAGRKHRCIATLSGMAERTIGLMGVTKSFAMGGWRVGFAYAPEPVIEGMIVSQQHLVTCAGSFAQVGATAAIKTAPPDSVISLWREWEDRCIQSVRRINEISGIHAREPEGGFYAWIDISQTGRTSKEMADHLLSSYHVALVPGSSFGESGEGYLRMTCVKSQDELNEGLNRLESALS